ncbi:putative transcriptional regulator [Escherichia coli]|uniref:Putative transcriptional regulator n=1 Tax=Escherichia coli TaxID=562 RepID=A0A377D0X6_ECOLX|nr:putative transcriptional regulator [Escherichia coli]
MEAIRKIIFRQEVKKIIHIKADSTLQSMINAGEFPQGFRVGLRRRGWYEDDVPGRKNANRKHAERLLNGYHRYDKHEKSGPDMEPPF